MENNEVVFVELKGETFSEFSGQCIHRSKRDADTVNGEKVDILFCSESKHPCIEMNCNRIKE